LKNTPHSVACKRAREGGATKKLPASKHGDRAGEQRFDSARGFSEVIDACAGADVQKIFKLAYAKMAMLPYFSGPRAVCRLSLSMNADFLARIFT